jgi:hypothetical protein
MVSLTEALSAMSKRELCDCVVVYYCVIWKKGRKGGGVRMGKDEGGLCVVCREGNISTGCYGLYIMIAVKLSQNAMYFFENWDMRIGTIII